MTSYAKSFQVRTLARLLPFWGKSLSCFVRITWEAVGELGGAVLPDSITNFLPALFYTYIYQLGLLLLPDSASLLSFFFFWD